MSYRVEWDLNVSILLAGSGPEPDDQVSGYPAAVLHLDALCPGPLADPDGIQITRRPAAGAVGGPAGAADTASIDVPGQRIAQFPGVPGVQVDLVVGAVQSEADSALGGAAVEGIDK